MKKRFFYTLCFLSLTYSIQAMDNLGGQSSEEEIDILSMPAEELEGLIQSDMMFRQQHTPLDDFHHRIIARNKAIQHERLEEADVLKIQLNNTIEQREDLMLMADTFGNTALHIAAREGDPETFQILFEGLKIPDDRTQVLSKVNNNGMTVLHEAAFFGRPAIVKELLNNSIKETNLNLSDYIERVDKEGMTALDLAAENGRSDVIEELLKTGARSCEENHKQETPILRAAKMGHFDSVDMLLASSLPCIDLKDADGKDVLYYAAEGPSDALLVKLIALKKELDLTAAVKHAQNLEETSRDADEKTFRKMRVAFLQLFLR